MARVRPALCSTTSRATSMLRASAYLHQCATSSVSNRGNLGWVCNYWKLLESLLQGVYANRPKNNSIFPGASKVGSVHTLCLGVATVAHVSHLFWCPCHASTVGHVLILHSSWPNTQGHIRIRHIMTYYHMLITIIWYPFVAKYTTWCATWLWYVQCPSNESINNIPTFFTWVKAYTHSITLHGQDVFCAQAMQGMSVMAWAEMRWVRPTDGRWLMWKKGWGDLQFGWCWVEGICQIPTAE